MKQLLLRTLICMALLVCACISPLFAGYNLEVPPNPLDEYRMKFKTYSRQLLASYDRAFVDDYEGAIREVSKAIELLPEEGIGFAERAQYHRMLNNIKSAESDFNTAVALFDRSIDQYRPGADKKPKKNISPKASSADAARLVSTLRYQRGEAYFNAEQYRKASDDFAAACQGGHTASCSRIWDVKAIEKRGFQWVPLSARQFYDSKRVERPAPSVVRAWTRREVPQLIKAESTSENYIQQLVEMNCVSREFRLVEALVTSSGGQQIAEKVTGSVFSKPTVGSPLSKLMILLCSRQQPNP